MGCYSWLLFGGLKEKFRIEVATRKFGSYPRFGGWIGVVEIDWFVWLAEVFFFLSKKYRFSCRFFTFIVDMIHQRVVFWASLEEIGVLERFFFA